jgi:acyl-CoA reductase-like NAD-dependent aldehyde dehydrogenase
VFVNSAFDSEIHTEDIFGPVSVVNKFTSEAEVLGRCNDTSFGLMSGVFTKDINRALRFASRLDSGVVGVNCVNCVSTVSISCPFGGTKDSGVGRELGHYASRSFTEPKTILVNMTYQWTA